VRCGGTKELFGGVEKTFLRNHLAEREKPKKQEGDEKNKRQTRLTGEQH